MNPTKKQIIARNKTFEELTQKERLEVYELALQLMAQQLNHIYDIEGCEYDDKIVREYEAGNTCQTIFAYLCEAFKFYRGEE